MIGKLKGIIDTLEDDNVIIDVGGVGYQVFASSNTLAALPEVGQTASLYIETHVREDHIHLYGFAGTEEKEWFSILTTVKGVGTKMALAILSAMNPQQLQTGIAAQDKAAFTQISGVGPRLAERLLTELKNKVDKVSAEVVPIAGGSGDAKEGNVAQDAISALTNLGYNRSTVYTAVQKASATNPDSKLEDLIREGLKELGS